MKRIQSFHLALACLCITASALAEPEFKGTPAELAGFLTNVPPTVRVSGESEVKVQADRACLTVKLTATAKDLGQALRSLQQVRSRFTTALTAQGLGSEAVQASKFSFTQKTGVFSDKVKSHTVSHLLKITVKNEKDFQSVADAIDSTPEAQYLGAEFQRSDKDEIQQRAIANACVKAGERKQVFEKNLGLRLTPKSFRDPGIPQLPENLITAGLRNTSSKAPSYDGSSYASVNTTLEQSDDQSGFGELTFTARVTVEYACQPN